MKRLLVLSAVSLLCACPPVVMTAKCETDAGTPEAEAQFRFVNLGREAVVVTVEGEDAGQSVPALQSMARTSHITLIKQRGTVQARNFLPDGGREAVVLPFDFDTTDAEPATFVLKDTSPNRISMNVTVGRQTQGATFGEKVRSSLAGVEVEGGVDFEGDCAADQSTPAGTLAKVALRGEPKSVDMDCAGSEDDEFVRPGDVEADATPYFIRNADGSLGVAWVGKVNAGLHAAGGALAQGASRTFPGGVGVSAATTRLYVLNAHNSGMPATVTLGGVQAAKDVPAGGLVRVKTSVVSRLSTGAIVGIAVGTAVSSFAISMNGEDTLLVVSENVNSPATVMKYGRPVGQPAAAGLGSHRLLIPFATTSTVETTACVAAFQGDDTCAMGAAAVSSVGNLAGGAAAQASYARLGQLLYPPKEPPAAGTAMLTTVTELPQRFVFSNPAGLTPVASKFPGGFAIAAAGTSIDATAVQRRALFFVDTTVTPWKVQSSLSK